MKQVKVWFREQCHNKSFRIWMAVMLTIFVLEGLACWLFQYGIWKVIRYLILYWFLAGIAWIDSREKRIPNQLLLYLAGARSVILLIECLWYQEYWKSILISAGGGFLLGGGMFLLCFVIARQGIGAGDVKLMAVLGYCMGAGAIITAIFLSVLAAALYGVGALLLKKASLKQEVPFAPFVLVGTILTILLGV